MNIRERIENNLVIFFLATLFIGFLAGIGTYEAILKIALLKVISEAEYERYKISPTGQPVDPPVQEPKKIFRYDQLPKEGQIIIPKGFYFQIKTNMQGNARKFQQQDTKDNIIKFSSGVAKDRAKLYDRKVEDFPTVIWENSEEQYGKDIIKTLNESPKNNTIENITKPMVLYSDKHIIMFEYSMN